MYARSLLGRFTRLVMGASVGAQSDRSREKSPCVRKLYDGCFLASVISYHRFSSFVIETWRPEAYCTQAYCPVGIHICQRIQSRKTCAFSTAR